MFVAKDMYHYCIFTVKVSNYWVELKELYRNVFIYVFMLNF